MLRVGAATASTASGRAAPTSPGCSLRRVHSTDARPRRGATVELIAPRPGDPADHVVIASRDGRRVGAHEHVRRQRARPRGARRLRRPATAPRLSPPSSWWAARCSACPARRSPGACCRPRPRRSATSSPRWRRTTTSKRPVLVAVGGGAGGLGRAVAAGMGLELVVPEHAEVISAVGDALSLIRVEREQTVDSPTPRADAAASSQPAEAKRSRRGRA